MDPDPYHFGLPDPDRINDANPDLVTKIISYFRSDSEPDPFIFTWPIRIRIKLIRIHIIGKPNTTRTLLSTPDCDPLLFCSVITLVSH